MKMRILSVTATLALLSMPLAVHAQSGAPAGAAAGAIGGAIVGGPPGAVVGGVAGAIVGGLATEQRPRFKQYVVTQKRPSYRYAEPIRIGARLPREGVTYYEVPPDYGVTKYRYTVVNDQTVLVDPATGEIVEIVD